MKTIGVIHTPYTTLEDMPIQPKGAKRIVGTIEVNEQYVPGLMDLDGFSHVYLLYKFHMAQKTALKVTPFMDTIQRGVFSTRSPLRPNHIGLSLVELKKIKTNIITVQGIDVLDGTPLLDIKPYIAAFDEVQNSSSGWMQSTKEEVILKRSDRRFAD
jgi:tRNA-Thr(GGU) m(6)t(6)A37 methyltransferase TsaA